MDMCDGDDNDPRTWADTAGELYENNYGTPNGTCGNTLNTSTVSGGVPAPTSAHGQWANLMPAISYACDHGVAGACAAWTSIYTSSNISDQTTTAAMKTTGRCSEFGLEDTHHEEAFDDPVRAPGFGRVRSTGATTRLQQLGEKTVAEVTKLSTGRQGRN